MSSRQRSRSAPGLLVSKRFSNLGCLREAVSTSFEAHLRGQTIRCDSHQADDTGQ